MSDSHANNKPIHKTHTKAEGTARHYGFHTFGNVHVQKEDLAKVKNFKDSKKNSYNDKSSDLNFDHLLEEKIALMRAYMEKTMNELSQPPMICYSGPLIGNPHRDDNSKVKFFNLDIIGNGKSIADAIVIETAYVILKEHLTEEGAELIVEINSIGDKDSFARFSREFTAFCKKRINELPAPWRAAFKKDPFSLFDCREDSCTILQEEAPKPMSYLLESSRDHFREVLEYIESLGIPYVINHSLIGSKHHSSGTIFRIIKTTPTKSSKPSKKASQPNIQTNTLVKQEVLAIGERYNTVSRKAWGKKEVPAIGASIVINEKGAKEIKNKGKETKQADIKFYFIQLGYDAKLKSLSIIEMLHVANIPVHQSLSRDKITSQLAAAEKMNVPYILILGQKEAIEDSVTVRHMLTRVQETVKINELVNYLKKLA